MRLLRNYSLGLKIIVFHVNMKLQTSVQSIFVSIFRFGLLRLSAGIYKATFSTAANVMNHLERFWPTSFQFGNVQKALLLSLRGKIIANILRFLGQRESKLVQKNSKKLPKLFQYGIAEKNFRQKRPECPSKFRFSAPNTMFGGATRCNRGFAYDNLFPAFSTERVISWVAAVARRDGGLRYVYCFGIDFGLISFVNKAM